MQQQKEQLIQTLLPELRARVLADAERQAWAGEKFFILGSVNYPELNGKYRKDVRDALIYLLRKDLKKHRLYMTSYCFVYFKRDFTDALFCIGVIAMTLIMMIAMMIALIVITAYPF